MNFDFQFYFYQESNAAVEASGNWPRLAPALLPALEGEKKLLTSKKVTRGASTKPYCLVPSVGLNQGATPKTMGFGFRFVWHFSGRSGP